MKHASRLEGQKTPRLIVVAAFDHNEDGELVQAFDPLQMQSEGTAINKARLIAGDRAGVIA
ncbi:hypothetical protein [Maritalea sp.]|uniref:hypothetical protein n=1 Tax=Maritalea sp. TaxID=2003361 RepID=UPI003EF0B534